MRWCEVEIDGKQYLQCAAVIYVAGSNTAGYMTAAIPEYIPPPAQSIDDALVQQLVDSNIHQHGHQKVIDTLIDLALE